MKKLHIGCGIEYRKGWTNIDINPKVKADFHLDMEEELPFSDNEFDYVYTSSVLEHIRGDLFKVMDEIYRISKPNAIIEILVPHYTSILAFKYPQHYKQFGIDSFTLMRDKLSLSKERYGKSRFKVLKQELHLVLSNMSHPDYKFMKYTSILNKLNFLFNFNKFWQLLMERIWFIGFDEIKYKLQVIKSKEEK